MARVNKKKLKRQLKEKPVTLTRKEVDKLKSDATSKAVEIVKLFPIWILRDKYGFGKKRITEFAEHYNELWDAYNKGYITLEDITNQLELETGLEYKDVADG